MHKRTDVDLASLPKIGADDLKLLWVNDFYDGPLEAVVEQGGVRLLMVLHGEPVPPDRDGAMRWVLFTLTDAQWEEEKRWHALFEEHVGHHWCFHHDTPPEPAEHPTPERFYGPYKHRTPLDLSASTPIGWIDEMPTG